MKHFVFRKKNQSKTYHYLIYSVFLFCIFFTFELAGKVNYSFAQNAQKTEQAKEGQKKNGALEKKAEAEKTKTEKSKAKTVNLSAQDLDTLIKTLETQKDRESLLNNLKVLKNALSEEEVEEKESKTFEIEDILAPVDNLSRKIILDANLLSKDAKNIPQLFKHSSVFLSDPVNYKPICSFLLRIGIVVLSFLFLDYIVKKLKRHFDKKRKEKIKSKVVHTFYNIIFEAMPYFIFVFLLVPISVQYLPSAASPQLSVFMKILQQIVVTFFYVAVLLLFFRYFITAILSPNDRKNRLLPITTRGANLLNAFLNSILNYFAFFFIVVYGLLDNWPTSILCDLLSKLLILPVPFIFTGYFLKLQRLWLSERPYSGEKLALASRIFGKATPIIRRFWLPFAIGYVWLISILKIFGLENSSSYFLKAILGTIGISFLFVGLVYNVKHFLNIFISSESRHQNIINKVIEWVFIILLAPFALASILFFWGLPLNEVFSNQIVVFLVSRSLSIAAICALVYFSIKGSNTLISWLLSGTQNSRMWLTLAPIIHTTFKAAVIFIGFISILDRIGVNVGPVLAGAGILGLGVGMGAQSLVKDIITGLSIILSDTIVIGDVATVAGINGTVESLGLRNVRIRDTSGSLSIIPNNTINTITNMTKNYSIKLVDVLMSYETDLDFAYKIINEVGEKMLNDSIWGAKLTKPVTILGVQELGMPGITVRVEMTCTPGEQWVLSREFKYRIKKAFDENDIIIPHTKILLTKQQVLE